MKEVFKELEEYLERGFPVEIALAKVLAHQKANGIPGVWRSILKTIEEEKAVRSDIIRRVPGYVRGEVKELLACTRTIKEAQLRKVSWGWFSVLRYNPDTMETFEAGKYYITSTNEELPQIVGTSEVQKIDEYDSIVYVSKEKVALLRTRSAQWEMQDFEIIGLLTYYHPYLLEVRLSERGKRAIEALERKILSRQF